MEIKMKREMILGGQFLCNEYVFSYVGGKAVFSPFFSGSPYYSLLYMHLFYMHLQACSSK